jgi:hypothetical protein
MSTLHLVGREVCCLTCLRICSLSLNSIKNLVLCDPKGPSSLLYGHQRNQELHIGNKTRVEGCIAEAFYLKEISYYMSTYFAEENNINAHIPRYHTSHETPRSNLKLF